jgi:hypothetical protein
MATPTPDEIDAIRSFIRARVRGFGVLDDVIEETGSYLEGTAEVPEGLAEQILAEEILALRADEERWASPTDNDRLDAAFAALDKQGILAEQDYWCCQNCGHTAAVDEVKKSKGRYKGYVFYHAQDTESAIEGGGLFLAFGTTKPDPDADVAVARAAVDALEREGLRVRWDGTVQRRPFVEMAWRKRRFTAPAR